MADFTPTMIQTCGIGIFLISNRGEGEPPFNATQFYAWAENADQSLPGNFLKDLNFCVFGLGNSTYPTFNKCGKGLNNFLELLGGVRIFPYGQGDDSQDLEEDFTGWKDQLWADFAPKYLPRQEDSVTVTNAQPVEGSPSSAITLPYTPVFRDGLVSVTPQLFDFKSAEQQNQFLSRYNSPSHPNVLDSLGGACKQYFMAAPVTVVVNRELRNHNIGVLDVNGDGESKATSDDQIILTVGSTRHVELDIINSPITRYDTAENLGVLPSNRKDDVLTVIKTMGYMANSVFEIVGNSADNFVFKPPFPYPCTVEEALTMYFDIAGPLQVDTLSDLVPFVMDSSQQSWLGNFCKPENVKSYNDLLKAGEASLCSLVETRLSSLKLPFDQFLHLIPSLKPRYYTISSSYLAYPQCIHLTLSVLAQKSSVDKKIIKGLCSSYISSLTNSGVDKIRIFLQPSTFKLPHPSVPIVMIGPGTGLAPMRALLQERAAVMSMRQHERYGSNILYFGCRRKDLDYIYEEELRTYADIGLLTRLHVAFSREQKGKRVYVQDLIAQEEHAAELLKAIDSGAYIYVCGATRMGNEIQAEIERIIASRRGESYV
jgi:NADPH-ferrihemoprotein reductase